MPQDKDNIETDPLILAAMIEDPTDDDEVKEINKKYLGDDSDDSDDSDDDSEDLDEDEEDSDDEDDEDDSKDDEAKPDPKKPVEADDDEEDEDEEEDDKPKNRKEKRSKRHEDYLQSIRKDNAREYKQPEVPEYEPINYAGVDEEGNPIEFKPEDLSKDRDMAKAVGFVNGVAEARQAQIQDNFWKELEYESRLISYDPELSFLSETKADGTPNPDFDPDRTLDVNQRYLQLVGFKEHYQTDGRGNVLRDNMGNPIVIKRTVDRTDISYEKFARDDLNRLKEYAKQYANQVEDDTRNKIVTQRKNQGVRPGGGSRKSAGKIQLGDISRMSDEDFEANEAAIDARINEELGI